MISTDSAWPVRPVLTVSILRGILAARPGEAGNHLVTPLTESNTASTPQKQPPAEDRFLFWASDAGMSVAGSGKLGGRRAQLERGERDGAVGIGSA